MRNVSCLTVYGVLVPPCALLLSRPLLALIAAGCCLLLADGGRPPRARHASEAGRDGFAVSAPVRSHNQSYDAGVAGRLQFRRERFDPCPRCLSVGPGEVSVDFEVETGAFLKMTPRLLALRSGFSLSEQNAVHLPVISEYAFVGLDGLGLKKEDSRRGFTQGVFAQVELGTQPVRPSEVAARIIPPLQQYIQRMPRVKGRTMLLPLSRDIHYTGGDDLDRSCQPGRPCHMHWTVGLQLSAVPRLLRLNPGSLADGVTRKARAVCAAGGGECAAEYEAIVSLAALVLRQAQGCKKLQSSLCTTPKRCMLPWLVRTHFGDLMRYVQTVVSEDVVANFPSDVLEVWGGDGEQPIFKRFENYLTLQEMAEIGGLTPQPVADTLVVQEPSNLTAVPEGSSSESAPESAATGEEELLQLARNILRHTKQVHRGMAKRPCGVYGVRPISPSTLTARSWLEQIVRGRDLMSDGDSPISRSSLSQLTFKSMGAWRMQGGEDRVYLECRSPKSCLDQRGRTGLGVANQMALVAQRLQELEDSS